MVGGSDDGRCWNVCELWGVSVGELREERGGEGPQCKEASRLSTVCGAYVLYISATAIVTRLGGPSQCTPNTSHMSGTKKNNT